MRGARPDIPQNLDLKFSLNFAILIMQLVLLCRPGYKPKRLLRLQALHPWPGVISDCQYRDRSDSSSCWSFFGYIAYALHAHLLPSSLGLSSCLEAIENHQQESEGTLKVDIIVQCICDIEQFLIWIRAQGEVQLNLRSLHSQLDIQSIRAVFLDLQLISVRAFRGIEASVLDYHLTFQHKITGHLLKAW